MTALHWAIKRNHLELSELLIRYHADPNAKDLVLLIFIKYFIIIYLFS